MLTLIKMAARNLLRHKRRSFLTGLMIAVGALTMLLSLTFSHSVEVAMTKAAVKGYAGNILIHAETKERIELFYPSDELPLISQADRLRDLIVNKDYIYEVAPRLRYGGMLAGEKDNPSGVVFTAIDPHLEPRVTPRIKVLQGSYLSEPDGMLLGKTMAKALDAEIGQEYILLVANPDGYLNGYPFKVQGIVTHEGMGMFLDYMVYIDLETARKLLYLTDNEAFELAIALKEGVNEQKVLAAIKEDLTAAGYKLRIDSWRTVLGIFYGIILGIKVLPQIMLGIIMLVVAVGIINTIIVSVLERVREIGTMMALGAKGREILKIFLGEAAILSSIAAVTGLFIGVTIILWLGRTGIPVTVEAMEFFCGGKRFYFIFSWFAVTASFSGTVLISIVTAYFPARMATRLKPVEALRED